MAESELREHAIFLFVYGTLRSELVRRNPALAELMGELDLVGRGRVRGELYDLGSHPGAVLGDDFQTWVCGEIYRLPRPEETLRALDVYEGFVPGELEASLFARVEARVVLEGGEARTSWVYAYNDWVSHEKLIPGGDYASYLREKDNVKKSQ